MKFLIILVCSAIYGLIVTSLKYAGITLGGLPTILLLILIYATVIAIYNSWKERKSQEKRCTPSVQSEQPPANNADAVERWYTCHECGSLVREGEECDCVAKRKEVEASKRAYEATVNESPTVWAYRWINSQRSIGAISEDQHSRMSDIITSWEPKPVEKTTKRNQKLPVILGVMCSIFVMVSIALGIVLAQTYTENKNLNASISTMETDYEKLEADYKEVEKNYKWVADLSKQQVAVIAKKNERIKLLENGFNPENDKWGEAIYNNTVCVVFDYGKKFNNKEMYIIHTTDCPLVENVPLKDRTYFQNDQDANFFCINNSLIPIFCSECDPPDLVKE